MLISLRTPLRVSFFAGGTDYPAYFERSPGAVVGITIDRYNYISALKLIDIIDHKYRVTYSKLELVTGCGDIEHPVVRTVLGHYGLDIPHDISIQSDLPASSGLGSSSAFTVGFVKLVSALEGQSMTRLDLGQAAIYVEQHLLKENVGVQDQLHAAFGGLNRFDFVDGRIRMTPVQRRGECQDHLLSSLVLVYTGQTRHASKVASKQLSATRQKELDVELSHLLQLVCEAVEVLEGDDPEIMLEDFGALMHEGWKTKRELSAEVSSPEIDTLYDAALSAGALGGKLCGAGSGGFLLMVVPPCKRARFEEKMDGNSLIGIGMDRQGSVILTG